MLLFFGVISLSYLAGNFLLSRSELESVSVQSRKGPENTFHVLPDALKIPKAISINPPTSFSEIAKKVKPTVVNISTTKKNKTRVVGVDPYFRNFFGPNFGAPPSNQEKDSHSLGTGFIINEAGDIITNNHVIEDADEIVVKLDDGREIKARLVGRDPKLDVAILKLVGNTEKLPYANLGNSDVLDVGDWVVAVGNPFGLGQTVTAGIVSAKERVLGAGPYDDFIQTDASINPGNSGGPLFNLNGEVVGINTAIIASGQGIGFAIPINMAKNVIPQLLTKGSVSRGWLGVAISEMTVDVATKQGLTKPTGALIKEVVPQGPADVAGIKSGDVVVEFNGQPVDKAHTLPNLVAREQPGTESKIVFLHNGSRFERTIKLGSLEAAETGALGSTVSGIMGLTVRDLSPQEKRQVRYGVVVTQIEEGSSAEALGVEQGDLLVEIGGQAIESASQFKKVFDAIQPGKVIRMGLARGNQMYYFAFRKE